MMVVIRADLMVCEGHANCSSLAPDYFGSDDDGHVVIMRDTPAEEDLDLIQDAVDSCPMTALRLDPR